MREGEWAGMHGCVCQSESNRVGTWSGWLRLSWPRSHRCLHSHSTSLLPAPAWRPCHLRRFAVLLWRKLWGGTAAQCPASPPITRAPRGLGPDPVLPPSARCGPGLDPAPASDTAWTSSDCPRLTLESRQGPTLDLPLPPPPLSSCSHCYPRAELHSCTSSQPEVGAGTG